MADILAIYGRRDWVEDHTLADEATRVWTFYSDRKEWACRLGFRSGPSPWPGGATKEANTWVGWLGDLRDIDGRIRSEVRESPGAAMYAKWRDKRESGLAELHGRVAGFLVEFEPLCLHVFRDKLGTIPLAFASDEGGTIVASDSAWFLDVRQRPRRPNLDRLRWFLTWSEDRGRDDFYRGLERLRPGELGSWRREVRPEIRSYWSPDTEPLDDPRVLETRFSTTLERVFDDVSRRRPIVSMSGGFDSVLVAAALAARSNGLLDVVSQIAPGMPIVNEDDDIREVESFLPLRVHRYDITDHLPFRDDTILSEDFGTGPVHHGGERADVEMRRWVVDKLDFQTLALGSGAEMLAEIPRWRATRAVLQSGNLRGWRRLLQTNSPIALLKQWGRAMLEPIGVFQEVAPLYRALRNELTGRERREAPWWEPTNWVIDPPSPDRDEPSARLSLGEHKLRALEGWCWECICRGRERQARRSNTNSVEPYLDDRLWALALQFPPVEMLDAWLLRRCARTYLPDEFGRGSNNESFNPFVERGIASQTDWIERHFKHSRLGSARVIRENNFRELCRRYVDRVHRKESLGLRVVSHRLLWDTLSAEYWMGTFDSHRLESL